MLKVFKIEHFSMTNKKTYFVLALDEKNAIEICKKQHKNVDFEDNIIEIKYPNILCEIEDY